MRKLFVRLLLRLVGLNYRVDGINEEMVNEWLVLQYQSKGFREYFKRRDIQLLKSIAVGVDRENYLLMVGQRLELLSLLNTVESAFRSKDKK